MANKKEAERAELHRTIWAIANDLRGSVDGWDFKQYVLGMLFYRFISENITEFVDKMQRDAGDSEFSYLNFSDEESLGAKDFIVTTKGFFIKPSELFANVRAGAKNNEDLNVTLSNVFNNIEHSADGTQFENDIKGLFDDMDVNSNKLGGTVEQRNKMLRKILDSIGDLQLGTYQDNSIDAFGDAYEYLMGMYAANAGKSGGEYFTPQEVSELLAMIATDGKEKINKVYDPACGERVIIVTGCINALRSRVSGTLVNMIHALLRVIKYNYCKQCMRSKDVLALQY